MSENQKLTIAKIHFYLILKHFRGYIFFNFFFQKVQRIFLKKKRLNFVFKVFEPHNQKFFIKKFLTEKSSMKCLKMISFICLKYIINMIYQNLTLKHRVRLFSQYRKNIEKNFLSSEQKIFSFESKLGHLGNIIYAGEATTTPFSFDFIFS
jgi:hypothetical protein